MAEPQPSDTGRRGALLAAKLAGVVRDRWGGGDRRAATFPGGAALREGERGWVLADERPERALGPALAWAARGGVTDLHLVVEGAGGLLARRAAAFVRPPTVWTVEGTALTEAPPDPLPVPPPLPEAAAALAAALTGDLRAAGAGAAAGVEVVVEGGVLRLEVLGLEVARVVVDESGVARVEVGVGKHDREATRLLHGDGDVDVAVAGVLAAAVHVVAERRRPDAEPHPINRLARERWLRAILVARPDLVGAARLAPAPSPVERDDLRLAAPAPACGEDLAGLPLLVVCSVGIDVDLVPAAADARLADGRSPRLVLAVPARDDHPITRDLAAMLRDPAEVRPLADDVWLASPRAG